MWFLSGRGEIVAGRVESFSERLEVVGGHLEVVAGRLPLPSGLGHPSDGRLQDPSGPIIDAGFRFSNLDSLIYRV
jgi:hypothetical protein